MTLAQGSTVHGAGDVSLYAGRDVSGSHGIFDFTGYTHAYAHALGGADSVLNTNFNVSDTLTIAGDVTAVRDINAVANIGDWSISETSRYWVANRQRK